MMKYAKYLKFKDILRFYEFPRGTRVAKSSALTPCIIKLFSYIRYLTYYSKMLVRALFGPYFWA